jgi:hypothetical protein
MEPRCCDTTFVTRSGGCARRPDVRNITLNDELPTVSCSSSYRLWAAWMAARVDPIVAHRAE